MTSFYEDDLKLRQVLKSGKLPDKLIRKEYIPEIKVVEDDSLQIDFLISTDSVDRYGDTVEQTGWDLKNYKKNPVVLFGHDGSSPPVAKCIPRSLKIDRGGLFATAEFMSRDMYSFSFMIYQMYAKGFLKATSVGFAPKEWTFVEDNDRPFGIDFKEQELLEFSCVPIPANPEALIQAKSLGIELSPLKEWAEKTLDTWGKHKGLLVPRETVEKVYFQTKTKDKTVVTKTLFVPDETSKKFDVITGEFEPDGSLAIALLKEGIDISITYQKEMTPDEAKLIMEAAVEQANDEAVVGFVFEVGKSGDKDTLNKLFEHKVEKLNESATADNPDDEQPAEGNDPDMVNCPDCGTDVILQDPMNYCPICGAKMNKAHEGHVVRFVLDAVDEKSLKKLSDSVIEVTDLILDAVESKKDFSSRGAKRALTALVEQSKLLINSLDLEKINGKSIDNEEIEETFELIEDKLDAVSDDESVSLEEAKSLLVEFNKQLEQKFSEKIKEKTNSEINKLKGKVD